MGADVAPGCARSAATPPMAAAASDPNRIAALTCSLCGEVSGEGQLADQQRDGEADTGHGRDRQQVEPASPSGRGRAGEPDQQERRQQDAEGLAEHQAEGDTLGGGVGRCARQVARVEAHTGGEQGEDRDGEAGGDRAPLVLERSARPSRCPHGRRPAP